MIASAKMEGKIQREIVSRLALVPVFVAVCYLFEWWQLRAATTIVLLKLSAILHLPMGRAGTDLVNLDGMRIQFGLACTMVDAFFGAIPLLWRRSIGAGQNIARLAAVFVGIFALNISRLELGFVAMHRGAPWWLAHECVAGVGYFCIFLFIMRVRAWEPRGENEALGELSSRPAFA